MRGRGATRHGAFLRSEAPEQGYGTARLAEDGPASPGGRMHELSHGESFLSAVAGNRDQRGLLVLDEPESGLSFPTSLSLLTLLVDLMAGGWQVILATHSPVLSALPTARIVELGEDGFRETTWEALDLVAHQRRFLADPQSYLRHIAE